jgi:hypothetical protein
VGPCDVAEGVDVDRCRQGGTPPGVVEQSLSAGASGGTRKVTRTAPFRRRHAHRWLDWG